MHDVNKAMMRRASLSDQAVAAARQVLAGQRGGMRAYLTFAGPAVIASIAYMDPGNFATNIQAGAKYGYSLLWVVLLANLIAMLFQALSAKLGIVTGRNLAELCRDHFPQPVVWAMWVVSEIAAMATDLAEFLGGAIGLSLLFHLPLFAGMIVTAIVTYGLLMLQGFGFRPIELIIGAMVTIIALCYLAEMFIAPVNWAEAAFHTFTPQLADAGALLLAVGIIGATVMPHAVYLHSGLTQARMPAHDDSERRTVLRFSNREVVVALSVAGLVNMAMVMMASSAFHAGHPEVAEIETGGSVSGVTHRLRDIVIHRRHDGRTDDHAGLRRFPHPGLGPPAGDDAAGPRHRRARCQCDERAGHEPGSAEHRVAAADGRASHLHRPARHHGGFRERSGHARRRLGRDRGGARPQPFSYRPDVRGGDPGTARRAMSAAVRPAR
jgi:NRAMP (natural resistance-associated macrophage protein)-like metal ion transporter